MGVAWTVIWVVFYFNADHLAGVYRSMDGVGLHMIMPAMNQEILLSYLPLVLPVAVLEIGLGLYKWKERQWTMKLMTLNAAINIFGLVVFIMIASNPALINDALVPYMANLLEITTVSVNNFIQWAIWTVVVVVIITTVIEIYESYRKAKIQ